MVILSVLFRLLHQECSCKFDVYPVSRGLGRFQVFY